MATQVGDGQGRAQVMGKRSQVRLESPHAHLLWPGVGPCPMGKIEDKAFKKDFVAERICLT